MTLSAYTPSNVYGSGVSAADYDNDGDIDLLLTSFLEDNIQLLKNVNGQLEATSSILPSLISNSRSAIFFDYNGENEIGIGVWKEVSRRAGPSRK